MKLSDLHPYPTAREQVRAMRAVGPQHDIPKAEWSSKLAEHVRAEREAKAAR